MKTTMGIICGLMLVAAILCFPGVTFAVQGVTVSITADKDVYLKSSLDSAPIIVNITVTNNSDDWLVLTEDQRKLNAYAQFGNLQIIQAARFGQGGSPVAVKGLAFKDCTLPAYQNVSVERRVNYFYKANGQSLLGIYIGPHESKVVARAEICGSEFNSLFVANKVYEIIASIPSGSIWNWITKEEAKSTNGPGFEAVLFVRIK